MPLELIWLFYERWSVAITFGVAVINFLLALFLDHRYRIVARFRTWIARIFNQPMKMQIMLSYASSYPMEAIKAGIRDSSNNGRVVGESKVAIDLAVSGTAYRIVEGDGGATVISIGPISCGLNELSDAVGEVAREVESWTTSGARIAQDCQYAQAVLHLPYQWGAMNLQRPLRFSLTNYQVDLTHIPTGAHVEIRPSDVTIRTTSLSTLVAALTQLA